MEVISIFTPRTKMGYTRVLLFLLLLTLLILPTPAPFPPGDPRAFLNPFIEPWWCKVPKIMR